MKKKKNSTLIVQGEHPEEDFIDDDILKTDRQRKKEAKDRKRSELKEKILARENDKKEEIKKKKEKKLRQELNTDLDMNFYDKFVDQKQKNQVHDKKLKQVI